MLAVLYDIHGNLPALEAVLADVEDAGARSLPARRRLRHAQPLAARDARQASRELPQRTWIRGNGERWLREPPGEPKVIQVYEEFEGVLTDEEVDRLYGLPMQAELDGILYVHGSPSSDVESFASAARGRRGAHARRRPRPDDRVRPQPPAVSSPGPDGTDLVNPGSVGMPLDGDVRAAWATWDGDFAFRRTEYDVERAAAAYRSMGGEFGEFAANRILKGSD